MDSTKDRIVAAAMGLFAERGYGGTPMSEILRVAGANAGSLYYVFPTKQDLLVEVLKRYRDGIGPMLLDPAWRGVTDPIARVFALLAAYRQLLEQSDCSYGCPIGSLALELHEPDPQVRELLAQNFAAWRRAVSECFRDAGLDDIADTSALAALVLAVMEGGVMQARTHRSLEIYDAAVSQLRSFIETLAMKGRRP